MNIWKEASSRGFEETVLTVTGTERGRPEGNPPSGPLDVPLENNLNKSLEFCLYTSPTGKLL